MTTQSLYKIKRKTSVNNKAKFMVTTAKWDSEGKFFTAKQVLKLLSKINKHLEPNQTLPDDWEVVEYQLIETRETPVETWAKYKSKTPWVRGIS